MSYQSQRPPQDPNHYSPLPGTYYPPPSQTPQHQVYQGYFNQGYPYPPPPPSHQHCQYQEYHHHHHNNHHNEYGVVECFSFLKACLAALRCCCMREECCFCLRCCL